MCYIMFFFKQKTAYEMRISDWSSDVCSSDLSHPLDFVQFTYNVLDREAEARLLPLAADRGQAVIVNRPFRHKALIRQVQGHPLPDWAAEFGAASWPQFLLKFVISHPSVTCVIQIGRAHV